MAPPCLLPPTTPTTPTLAPWPPPPSSPHHPRRAWRRHPHDRPLPPPPPPQSVVPARYRHDKQLVSHNIHESTYNYKYTFSVEIAPICKVGSLVCRVLV